MAQETERFVYTEQEQYTSVNFTNIDTEDFEGSFGGNDVQVGFDQQNHPIIEKQAIVWTVKSGETRQFPMPLADHLAYHLAMKMLMRDEPNVSHQRNDGKVKELMAKILGAKVEKKPEVKEAMEEEFAGLEELKTKKSKT